MTFKLIVILLFIGLAESCGKKSCPDEMHEQKLPDGTTICVPNNL
jgi:hypothetical protein